MRADLARIISLLFVAVASAHAQDVIVTGLSANSIGYSAQTGMLYATIPSLAGLPYGNNLIEISPDDLSVTRGVWVGSEPGPLAISPDAPVAYVGLSGAASVRAVDLVEMTAGLQFTLGRGDYTGAFFAEQIAVMPGDPATVAVSRRNITRSPRFEGVAIYDSGVMRPLTAGYQIAATAIAFGSDPNLLFGLDTQDTAGSLSRMEVSASGVSVLQAISTPFAAVTITAVGSDVFGNFGDVADGQTLETLGHYDASGVETIVGPTHSVIFANNASIEVFNRYSYGAAPVVTLYGAYGTPRSAAACGLDCLAVVYDSGYLFLFKNYNGVVFAADFE